MTGLVAVAFVALAVPAAEAAPLLPGNAAAGIALERVRPRLRRYLGVPAGLLVVETLAGSPAEQAGLRTGDVVVEAKDGRAFSPSQVSLLVSLNRGGSVPLLVYRDGVLFGADLQVPPRDRGREAQGPGSADAGWTDAAVGAASPDPPPPPAVAEAG